MKRVFINNFPTIYEPDFTFETFNFGGGEVHVRLNENIESIGHYDFDQPCIIYARANNSDDVMRILLTNDAIKNKGYRKISLVMPYIPYARQDSVMVEGEAFSLRVFANLINSCGFQYVSVLDPHSGVAPALINNCRIITNENFVRAALADIMKRLNIPAYDMDNAPLLCSPDAGSFKKIFKLAKALGNTKEIICCNKARELSSGKIEAFSVSSTDLKRSPVIIIDDICAKGGTFMGLATRLKELNSGNIYLCITHYEGHADSALMKQAGIEHVYTSPSIGGIPTGSNGYITEIGFEKVYGFISSN